jgi:hypothetical protein
MLGWPNFCFFKSCLIINFFLKKKKRKKKKKKKKKKKQNKNKLTQFWTNLNLYPIFGIILTQALFLSAVFETRAISVISWGATFQTREKYGEVGLFRGA